MPVLITEDQVKAYFLQRYEQLKPLVLDTINVHRAELMAVVDKMTAEMGDVLVNITPHEPVEQQGVDTQDIEVSLGDLNELQRMLVNIYVAGFLFEQLPAAEEVEMYAEQAWSGGRHDGRALRVGQTQPRH